MNFVNLQLMETLAAVASGLMLHWYNFKLDSFLKMVTGDGPSRCIARYHEELRAFDQSSFHSSMTVIAVTTTISYLELSRRAALEELKAAVGVGFVLVGVFLGISSVNLSAWLLAGLSTTIIRPIKSYLSTSRTRSLCSPCFTSSFGLWLE
jgi:hypothetical protein